MDTKVLRTFLAVAHLLNFRKAAQELNYSQSTISDHIQIIEQNLGVQVFERLGRKIYLNEYGKKLVPYAKRIVQDELELFNEMHSDQRIAGRLRIGAAETLAAYWLPAIIKEYHLLYPQVEVVITMADCMEFTKMLEYDQIDIAFSMHDETGNDLITQYPMFEDITVLIAAPDHPLASSKVVTVENLEEVSLIQTEAGCCYRIELDAFFKRCHIPVKTIMELTSLEAIKECVKSGLGISLLPRIAVEKEILAGELVAISLTGCKIPYRVNMIFHKQKWISPPLSAFCKHMLENHRKSP